MVHGGTGGGGGERGNGGVMWVAMSLVCMVKSPSEEAFRFNALDKVSRTNASSVFFGTGGGGHSLSS